MSSTSYAIRVHPSGPLGGYLTPPPSKNYTTRLLLGAALAEGRSLVRRPATNDDARALVACLRALGAGIEEEGDALRVEGFAGQPKNPGRLNPGNAGAVLRLLLGTACLVEGEVEFVTEYGESLGRRPNAELLAALRKLGAGAEGQGPEGRLPIRIAGGRGRVRGGRVRVSGARSSQFLSSLLFLCPLLEGDSTIEVTGGAEGAAPRLVSRPLIDQTLETLGRVGLRATPEWERLLFRVPGGQSARGGELAVNGDWPSSAALIAAVAVAGGMATLYGLEEDAQGERRAAGTLAAMGCELSWPRPGELVVHGKGELRATEFDGDLATDAVLAIVAAACHAEGVMRITNVGNLRLKECDRIDEPAEELRRLGVAVRTGPDWIEVEGRADGYEGGVTVDSHGDHRVAQMLAIVGLRCLRPVTITRAEHISKSYPGFFEDLARLGAHVERVDDRV